MTILTAFLAFAHPLACGSCHGQRSKRASFPAAFGVCLLLAFGVSAPTTAQQLERSLAGKELEITITGGTARQIPVGILDFLGASHEENELGRQLAGIIRDNLSRGGLLTSLDPVNFPQSAPQALNGPNSSAWRAVGAENLIVGQLQLTQYGRLNVEFYLWDTAGNQQMMALSYATMANNWRRIAHVISDSVMQRLTGQDGAFDTRIVYVAESGPKTQRNKQLAIMDQDGGNHRVLTTPDLFVTSPRFSPKSQEITYVAMRDNVWRVYLYNLETGQQEVISDLVGTPTAPRFSPHGNHVVVSLTENGNTDLYELDLTTRHKQRLTTSPGIDTAASYAPNGRQIVFESDRGGDQQLYIMDRASGDTRRISRGDGRYAGPVWSPTGEWIAFTKQYDGAFYIGIMRPDGSGERLITRSFIAESPTWAPNGRSLAYYKQAPTEFGDQMETALYAVDLYTFQERLVLTPSDASDPAWSPKLN